jgi:uncharacterized protein (TIGR00369 family)
MVMTPLPLYPILSVGGEGMMERALKEVGLKKAGAGQLAAAKLSVAELERLLSAEFPEMFHPASGWVIEAVWHRGSVVRKRFDAQSLRPGGTIAGTTTMAIADFAIYIAVLASIGWVPLTVTTNLNINFLKKPAPRDLLAEARLIKLGKRLAVGEIDIRSEGDDDLVAHATATYSIPPQTVK